MNTINNLTKLNLLTDANLHYAELQFQPQINQYIAEQQLIGSNYDQMNDESGFEEFNSGSVVGDGSYDGQLEYAKLDFLKNQMLNQNIQVNSPSHLINNGKQSRVNVVSSGTTLSDNNNLNNMNTDNQSINPNKFESTV